MAKWVPGMPRQSGRGVVLRSDRESRRFFDRFVLVICIAFLRAVTL